VMPEFCWAWCLDESPPLVKRVTEFLLDCPRCGAVYLPNGSWRDGTGRESTGTKMPAVMGQLGTIIEATFAPVRTDDLKVGLYSLIGQRFRFAWIGVMDEGEYDGEEMWEPFPPDVWLGVVWLPACDLTDVVELPHLRLGYDDDGPALVERG
jgi:hypothetical protein